MTDLAGAARGLAAAVDAVPARVRRALDQPGWEGSAGSAARRRLTRVGEGWATQADLLRRVAREIDGYAAVLGWAQAEAAATDVDLARSDAVAPYDAGGAARLAQAAGVRRRSALTRLRAAGDRLAAVLEQAADALPQEGGDGWDRVGRALGHALVLAGDAAQVVGGGLLMVLGAAGEGSGLALDATGVGAAVGVPVGVLATGAVVTGGAVAANGVRQLRDDLDRMYAESATTESASSAAPSAGSGNQVVKVEEQVHASGRTANYEVTTSSGKVDIITDVRLEGRTLHLDGLHIDGPGANSLGFRGFRQLLRDLGRSEGADTVVMHGGRRTTGANPGHVPREIVVRVGP